MSKYLNVAILVLLLSVFVENVESGISESDEVRQSDSLLLTAKDTDSTLIIPNENSPYFLDNIIVSSSRMGDSVQNIPYSIEVIARDDIRIERLAYSMPDILSEKPGIMIQKTSFGQGSPYLRGFTGFRTVCLIDGIRLNNSVFREGPNQYWNTIDPFSLDRLEAVLGSGSVLFGSDAVGGVVNCRTSNINSYYKHINLNSRLYYSISLPDNSKIGKIEFSGSGGGKLGAICGLSIKRFGDLHRGESAGVQKNTGYDLYGVDLKLEYLPDQNSRLVMMYQSVEQDDVWRTHSTIYGFSWNGTTIGSDLRRSYDQERNLAYINYQRNTPLPFIQTMSAVVSYQRQTESEHRQKKDYNIQIQGFEVGTFGIGIRMESSTGLGYLSYGFDYYNDMVTSYKNKYDSSGSPTGVGIQGPVADDSEYDSFGFYVQDEFSLRENLGFVLGGRYSLMRVDAPTVEDPLTDGVFSIDDRWSDISGSFRILYHFDRSKRWNVFAGMSQSFRAPNLSDLTRLDAARSNELETPSPELSPEKFLSCEAGLKVNASDYTFQATTYYTFIDNMIVRVPTGVIIDDLYEVSKRNSGNGYVTGLEIESRYRLNQKISISGAFSIMDGALDGYPTSDTAMVREPISRLMPTSFEMSLSYSPDRNIWVEGFLRTAARADKLSAADKMDGQRIPPDGTPGYTVFDIRGGIWINDNVVISAVLENIGNKDYRIHGSGVNEPGRRLTIGLNAEI